MIVDIIVQSSGEDEELPRNICITTTSTYEEVVSPGFLVQTRNNQFYSNDCINVLYDYNDEEKSGLYAQFTISFAGPILTLVPVIASTIVPVVGTTKTLEISDQGTIQDCSNIAGQTITVPSYICCPFTFGIPMLFKQSGVGQVTFEAGDGVTIQSISDHLKISEQYGRAYLIPMSQNIFWLYGNLSA